MTAPPDVAPRLLDVRGLTVTIGDGADAPRLVDDIDFHVGPGESLGIVGESGSGKSLTALSVLGLLPPALSAQGVVDFGGADLFQMRPEERRRTRGAGIGMIFQDPMTSLNPVLDIQTQMTEGLREHGLSSKRDAIARSRELLSLVGIPRTRDILNEYPHQLSGGMRQRVMIATALMCKPRLLIADEPTTALDVTIQAQILELLSDIHRSLGQALILITHDLGVVAQTCDRVVILYAGRVLESGPTDRVLRTPTHPYTSGLIRAIPPAHRRVNRLETIPGSVPTVGTFPPGCRFSNRCDRFDEACVEEPRMVAAGPEHAVRCWHALHEGDV